MSGPDLDNNDDPIDPELENEELHDDDFDEEYDFDDSDDDDDLD